MVPWVDRIHKDTLHSSVFAHHARKVTSVTTTAGVNSYTLTPTDIRRVELVYDTTFQRMLLPFDEISFPAPAGDPKTLPGEAFQAAVSALAEKTQVLWPSYYRLTTATSAGVNTHTLYIFPAPANANNAGTITIHYLKEVATLASATDKLEVPEDARDVVVAGVNWLAFSYLKRESEAQRWFQVYEALKRGERVLK